MKIFSYGKDGGPESTVDGFWLIEIKSLFSIVLLRFNNGTREKFHNHAFNALTWFLWGDLMEEPMGKKYRRSFIPKYTPRSLSHRVRSKGTSWVFTIRGPWCSTWQEYDSETKETITMTYGRKIV